MGLAWRLYRRGVGGRYSMSAPHHLLRATVMVYEGLKFPIRVSATTIQDMVCLPRVSFPAHRLKPNIVPTFLLLCLLLMIELSFPTSSLRERTAEADLALQ